jgi:hydroxyacylglutathione hydrolase
MTLTNSGDTQVRIRPIEAFSDNYIWLIEDGSHAVVVDPGDAFVVLDTLEAEGLKLTAILLTHHHHDHVGGVSELIEQGSVTVFGPAMESLPACDVALSQGDLVLLDQPNLRLNVLEVPGHTAGHIAYTGTIAGKSVLFCGDTLFVGGCGRLFEGTPEQMQSSFDQLAALPSNTAVYCAHEYTLANLRWARTVEPDNTELAEFEQQCLVKRDQGVPTVPSTLAIEKACNPFMRSREPSVIAAASKWCARPLASGADAFGALREWKNNFK